MTLVDEGKSDYQIVLPDEPTLVQETAAKELQSYLQRATGAELPIVAASDVAGVDDAKLLILGPGALSQQTPGIVYVPYDYGMSYQPNEDEVMEERMSGLFEVLSGEISEGVGGYIITNVQIKNV